MNTYRFTTESEVEEAHESLLKEQGWPTRSIGPDGETLIDSEAESQSLNDFIDALQKGGEIPPRMFYPGYDEDDPDTWE